MKINYVFSFVSLLILLLPAALGLTLAILAIKALLKYIRSGDVRREKVVIRRSLAEALRENRMRCKMTQEFVAESLGVSRQAVSKWETGAADPSTANLCELAKLYGVPAEELLASVRYTETAQQEGGDGDDPLS